MDTPLAQDQFSRAMAAAFDDRENMPAPGGFCAFFGRPETGADIIFSPDGDVIDIDIIRGNEKIAALIPRGLNTRVISGQKNTQEQQNTSTSRVFPLIEEEGDITASQLTKAFAGEKRTVEGQVITRRDRLRTLAEKQTQEHMRRVARTYEFLASQSIITGKQPAILGTTNADQLYDFRRNTDNFITVGTAWSDVSADIMGDIDDGCLLVRRNGRATPDMMVLSGVDMDAFIKNTSVKETADNRRFELIEVSTNNPVPPKFDRFIQGGFIARGRLRTPKGFELWMFTYIDSFDDGVGDPQPYLPDNKTIICSSMARCDLYFGPPEVLPVTSIHAQWMRELFGFNMQNPPVPRNFAGTKWIDLLSISAYFDAYPREGNKGVSVRTQAAPIFPTTQTDAFVTITTVP